MFRERLEQELKENKQLRTYIRKVAKCRGRNYPIQMVDGDGPPKLQGRRGTRVVKRNRRGVLYTIHFHEEIPNTYYAHSTRRIEVGSDWLLEVALTRNYMKVKHGEEKED